MTSIAIVRKATRALDGLSVEETVEFEMLDGLPPIDDEGNPTWNFEGEPTTRREKRWLAVRETLTRKTNLKYRCVRKPFIFSVSPALAFH